VIPIDLATDPLVAVRAALADRTRAEIVRMLAAGSRTAGEIHRAFPIAAPAVSRHLRVLREAGLVTEHRPSADGRQRVYDLEREPLRALATWLTALADSGPAAVAERLA
jgi:DNA-binding transcriptional ArsR family regulator